MLIGKGLSAWIIIKLISFNLAWMVVLVVPMAVLVSCLMTFGNLSQNNEIAILKATGISLYKMIIPTFVMSILLAWFLVYFNNKIYPDANHAARLLMQDISRKKPTLSLKPGVFSQEVASYSILAREINQQTNELKDITIYDYSTYPNINIVTAKEGKLYFAQLQKKLIMDLKMGEIHESSNSQKEVYRKLRFEKHKIAMPADQFTFEQSSFGESRSDREMGASQILRMIDSIDVIQKSFVKDYEKRINSIVNYTAVPSSADPNQDQYVYIRSQQRIRNDEMTFNDIISRINYNETESDRYWVEVHKKYALPFACIVFALIGVPLGTMTRKGGLGMAAGISLSFYVIYWSFLIAGEKLADRNIISPFIGIWSANFFLFLLGIWLLVKNAKERITLSFDFLLKFIPKSWKTDTGENENS